MRAASWISAAISAIAAALGLAALSIWAWNTTDLLLLAQNVAGAEHAARISYEMVAGAQRPLVLGAIALLVVAVVSWSFGPKVFQRLLSDWKALATRQAEFPSSAWLIVSGSVVILLVNVIQHINQPMRTDEAATFLRYGTRSVLAAVSWYSDTNNHILHSVLMRWSVLIFGDSAWAIRLPAAVGAILCVPAMYFAGLRLLGPVAAIFACLLFSTSPYVVDLATNARGYPLLILCFLLSLSLVPDLRPERPGAWAVLILLMAFGAWAVPIMLYPFAIVLAASFILVLGTDSRAAALRQIVCTGAAALATGLLVVVLYSPALLVLSLQTQAVPQGVQFVQGLSGTERADGLIFHVSQAWTQWIFPLTTDWSIPILLCAAWGVAVWLVQGKCGRALAIGTPLGFITVFAATGLAPVPWWSLGFLFPLLLLALSGSLADILKRIGIDSSTKGLALTSLLGAVLLTALVTGTYPRSYPNQVGFRDAERLATLINQEAFVDAPVFVRGYHIAPLRYYLRVGSHGDRIAAEDGIIGNPPNKLLHVDVLEDPTTSLPDPHPEIAQALMQRGCRRTSSKALPHSTISLFQCGDQ